MVTNIVLTDLTNGTLSPTNEWTGTGVFDILVNAVNKNIEGQYNLGRINATDYATVYLGGLQSVIQQSMQYLLAEKKAEADTDVALAQKVLVERQTKGFDDDANQKLLKQVLDSWSVGFSVSQTAVAVPDTIKVDAVDSVMKQAMTNLGMTVSTNPLGL